MPFTSMCEQHNKTNSFVYALHYAFINSKNLSLEQAQLICEHLHLTPQETEYFFCSLQVQRAGTVKLRSYFKQKLDHLRKASQEISHRVRQDRKLTEEEKSIFYSHWHYAAVWLQTSLGSGQSLDEISRRFTIKRERTAEILQFLVGTQLCLVEKDRYKMGPQSLHIERGSTHLFRHHSNWRLLALQANEKMDEDDLLYTGPMSMSKSDFKKVRSKLVQIIKDVTDVAIKSEAEEIVCLNLDFFFVK